MVRTRRTYRDHKVHPLHYFTDVENDPHEVVVLRSHCPTVEVPGQSRSVKMVSIVFFLLHNPVSLHGSQIEAECLDIIWAEQPNSLLLSVAHSYLSCDIVPCASTQFRRNTESIKQEKSELRSLRATIVCLENSRG